MIKLNKNIAYFMVCNPPDTMARLTVWLNSHTQTPLSQAVTSTLDECPSETVQGERVVGKCDTWKPPAILSVESSLTEFVRISYTS